MSIAQRDTGTGRHRGVALEEAVDDFRLACVSRAIDDREITLLRQSRVFFQISGAGHESLLLAFARELRPGYDWFFPYYRDRALVLGLGVSPRAILLQAVGAAEDPASGGRQMPCHWGDVTRNIVTQSSATGSQCLPAVGCAEAAHYILRRDLPGCSAHGDEITYVSLGEGATSEGEFWESLNTACRLNLPVLYVVADNGYAISVRATDQAPAPISELVSGFRGLHVVKLDGCDYFEARRVAADIVARVRAGQGPGLVHALVTRPYSHSQSDDQRKYRPAAELAAEAAHDPILVLEQELVNAGALTADGASAIREDARRLVAEVAAEVLTAPRPDPATVTHHLFAPVRAGAPPHACAPVSEPVRPSDPATALAWSRPALAAAAPNGERRAAVDSRGEDDQPLTMGDAIRRALHDEMARDERIRVFGEDVADADPGALDQVSGKGGVFGITFGLQREFGQARCYNTPLAEANIIGRAVGQAIRGLRPSPEIQFFDYIWPAMQQIKTEVATVRWRSNGAFSCPMVIRVAIGGYLHGGSIWHSQCGESIFAHIPGLLICFPSRARDAVGLLRTAFRGDDPVMFLEHKHLYRQGYNRDPYPPLDFTIPFGRGAYVTRGTDATVVTWGATVHRAVLAAREVDPGGTRIEIVDLRTIVPWDREMVAESVERTSKVLVLHEDTITCGFGAEVAAFIADECFGALDAPVRRRGALDTPVAYEPTLEDAILPQVSDIASDLRALLTY